MKRLARISIEILIILVTATTIGILGTDASFALPNSGQGIWVSAIGNHAILNGTGISVYLLTKSEYEIYRKDPNKYNLQNRGTTPLFLENVKLGEYFVGIEIIMDKNKTKHMEMVGPGIPKGASQPDPERTYADDVPSMMNLGLRVVSNDVCFYLLKWYSVTVRDRGVFPVVALFLKKDGTLLDWEKSYPNKDQFMIKMSADSLTSFWNVLGEHKARTTQEEREHLIRLLRRGGRICLPPPKSYHTIFVDAEGKLVASARINTNEIEIMDPIKPIKSVSSHTVDTKATGISKGQTGNIFPSFNLEINGNNEVRIKNPNDLNVTVGLRSGNQGKNFDVNANGVAAVFVPNGKYQIYFVYSNNPDALFRGDDFTLNDNGVEIQIVKVVGGNYGIRQVK